MDILPYDILEIIYNNLNLNNKKNFINITLQINNMFIRLYASDIESQLNLCRSYMGVEDECYMECDNCNDFFEYHHGRCHVRQ